METMETPLDPPLINVCGNAAGLRLPPFILYKGKHLYSTWTEGGPAVLTME